jgi:uracil-DNA glycosylase
VTSLRQQVASALGDWHTLLPRPWRRSFTGRELDFEVIPEPVDGTDAVWPMAGGGPTSAHVFKALQKLEPHTVRVVVFGNDPYTRQEQATGRSFEQGDLAHWAADIRRRRVSPSMQSIVAAAAATDRKNARYSLCDTRMVYDQDDDALNGRERPLWFAHVELSRVLSDGIKLKPPTKIFDHWTRQGVLWLNTTLTYTKWDQMHRDAHHALWAPFTARMLEILVDSARDRRIVFVLWGSAATNLERRIRTLARRLTSPAGNVQICKAGHPQWPKGYFAHGNPLHHINRALGKQRRPISWV